MNNEILQLLELPENELLFKLGYSLNGQKLGLNKSLHDKKKTIEFAENWLNKNLSIIKINLCKSEIISNYNAKQNEISEIDIISAIGDFLLQYWSLPSPLVLSVIIFKAGIKNLCHE